MQDPIRHNHTSRKNGVSILQSVLLSTQARRTSQARRPLARKLNTICARASTLPDCPDCPPQTRRSPSAPTWLPDAQGSQAVVVFLCVQSQCSSQISREATHLQKTDKAWEKTEGYRGRVRTRGSRDEKTCNGSKIAKPGENRSAGAGVFAIKNISIDSGSSSIGQKKTLRPGQPGRTRMLRARPGACVLFLLIYLRD